MESIDVSVEETASPLEHHSHIRRGDGSVYRELRPGTGSVTEYEGLDKVFYRERHAGFSLPEHRVMEDADEKTWLEVDYVDGVPSQRIVSPDNDAGFVDSFLSNYVDKLDRVISRPEDPFPYDTGIKQYVFSDDWYLVDTEQRVGYFDANNPLHRSNQMFLSSVNRVAA